MRITVYYRLSDGVNTHLIKRIVDGANLNAEMLAIEQEFKLEPSFRWMPSKERQIKILTQFVPFAFVDSLVSCEPFRRAVIEESQQERQNVKSS